MSDVLRWKWSRLRDAGVMRPQYARIGQDAAAGLRRTVRSDKLLQYAEQVDVRLRVERARHLRQYIVEHGEDMPDIRNWQWTDARSY